MCEWFILIARLSADSDMVKLGLVMNNFILIVNFWKINNYD